jgi:hypothetical protein
MAIHSLFANCEYGTEPCTPAAMLRRSVRSGLRSSIVSSSRLFPRAQCNLMRITDAFLSQAHPENLPVWL